MKKLFNLRESEFDRQRCVKSIEPPKLRPMSNQSALEACAEGSKLLLKENKDLMRSIYKDSVIENDL